MMNKWKRCLLSSALTLILASFGGIAAQEEEVSELVAGNTAFALDLYAAVEENTEGNLLFSPYSISQALAMTYAGAGGETAAQMADTLSFSLEQPA
ncbi:MAG TPA: serpin family protein, partial [Oceanobacillus sp.]|nr:serpin family protein [Oceanobacillus sp.]